VFLDCGAFVMLAVFRVAWIWETLKRNEDKQAASLKAGATNRHSWMAARFDRFLWGM